LHEWRPRLFTRPRNRIAAFARKEKKKEKPKIKKKKILGEKTPVFGEGVQTLVH